MLTMPAVHAREDLHDPIRALVARYRGEAEAGKRQVLTADMVSQDHKGLIQLINSGCYRAAVNLTTRILTAYGQGPGQNGTITRHTSASIKVYKRYQWHCYFVHEVNSTSAIDPRPALCSYFVL